MNGSVGFLECWTALINVAVVIVGWIIVNYNMAIIEAFSTVSAIDGNDGG
jgi:hypothetical protein